MTNGGKTYLTGREVSHILAALRYFQKAMDRGEKCPFAEIATNGGEFSVMSVEEIDHLCEAVNTRICVL
jgi:hypothetical protein